MIDKADLRIGTWVSGRNDPPMKVVSINYSGEVELRFNGVNKDYGDLYYREKELQPVILTPEILQKAGFKKWADDSTYSIEFENGNTFQVRGKDVFLAGSQACITGHGFLLEIQYLHQLQNLFFALCGEELKINL